MEPQVRPLLRRLAREPEAADRFSYDPDTAFSASASLSWVIPAVALWACGASVAIWLLSGGAP